MSDETFDVWPHDPTKIVKEALREYVGDGDGEDERVLAAHEKRVRERIARNIERSLPGRDDVIGGFKAGARHAVRIVREG